MKIAIAPNPAKKRAQATAQDAAVILTASGCECVMVEGLYDDGSARRAGIEIISGCQVLLAVGGDGTIICAAKIAAKLDIPVLGVNAGKLGFTAGVEQNQLQLLKELAAENWREERRMVLRVGLTREEMPERSFLALNDAVVSSELAKITEYSMAIGQGQSYTYRADGFIVATPTGSTAYSLSAGGPVVEPGMDCMVYSPICPHSLFNRSVVFAPESRLTVEIPRNRGRLFLTVDGEVPIELLCSDRLVFSRSDIQARFIKLTHNDFYDILNQKLLDNQ